MTDTPAPQDDFVLIGVVTSPFGVRGQVKVRSLTDHVAYLARNIRTIYVGAQRTAYPLQRVHEHKPGLLILTLGGVTTRDAAEALRGAELAIPESQTAPLAAGEYFLHQLFGLLVITEGGAELGRVREVLTTGANDVLIVPRAGQPDALIPMIRDVVQELDLSGGRIVIRLIPGLLDG
jgi:16S rRNA processing protein RimM